jgi:D-beta-D-heptose 7-phosphate kinase/D-beta-D-heptose 1-phosphate adenosyltransferase
MNKILVIGDSCIDSYTYCKVTRLAPDKPVPVLEVDRVEKTPGMAYNTFSNVKSLTMSCDLITNANWDKVIKNRYVDVKSNHMFVRVDEMQDVPPIVYDDSIFEYETIIISDYDKGFLTREDIYYICDNHKQVFLDTKKPLDKWASKAKFIKINDDEYAKSKDYIDEHLHDQVIKTLGAEGCSYLDTIYPVKEWCW